MALFLAGAPPAFATSGTPPTIDAPLADAAVAGVVSVSVTTNAPFVAARWTGTVVVAGATSDAGSAQIDLPSWGVAGTSEIEVAECLGVVPTDPAALEVFLNSCLDGAAADEQATVSVSVSNDAPVFAAGASLYWDPSTPFETAVTAPGGSVLFSGFPNVADTIDQTSPYAASFPAQPGLADGSSFELGATLCSTPTVSGEYVCESLPGDSLTVNVKKLTPAVKAASPDPFSPNGDGYKDSIRFTYTLDEATQSVAFRITDNAGTPITALRSLGTLAAGRYSFNWEPKRGLDLRSGKYFVQIATTATFGGVEFTGLGERQFQIDLTKPRLTSPSATYATFYPVTDGYRDTVSLSAQANERLQSATVEIFDGAGRRIRVLSISGGGPGAIHATWNGRTTSGTLVPAGAYRFRVTGRDEQRLSGKSGWGKVVVSLKRLVKHTAIIGRLGDQYASLWHTGPSSCVGYSKSASTFIHGLWLADVCMYDLDGYTDIEARYSFTVPGAFAYKSVSLQTYGAASPYYPIFLGGGMYVNGDGWQYADAHKITNGSATWRTIAYASGSKAGRLVSNRVVKGAVYLPGVFGSDGYDVGAMRLIVNYVVLE